MTYLISLALEKQAKANHHTVLGTHTHVDTRHRCTPKGGTCCKEPVTCRAHISHFSKFSVSVSLSSTPHRHGGNTLHTWQLKLLTVQLPNNSTLTGSAIKHQLRHSHSHYQLQQEGMPTHSHQLQHLYVTSRVCHKQSAMPLAPAHAGHKLVGTLCKLCHGF